MDLESDSDSSNADVLTLTRTRILTTRIHQIKGVRVRLLFNRTSRIRKKEEFCTEYFSQKKTDHITKIVMKTGDALDGQTNYLSDLDENLYGKLFLSGNIGDMNHKGFES